MIAQWDLQSGNDIMLINVFNFLPEPDTWITDIFGTASLPDIWIF